MVSNIAFIFPYIGNVMIPTDELIFFRGVGSKPPTRNYRLLDLCYPMIIPLFSNVNPLLNHQITIETRPVGIFSATMFQTKLDPAGGVWSWGQASTLVKIAVVAEIFLEMLRLVQAVCYGMLQHDYDYDGEIYNYNIYIIT